MKKSVEYGSGSLLLRIQTSVTHLLNNILENNIDQN